MEGFVELDVPGARILARPEARSWAEGAVEVHGSLHRAAARTPDALRMEGRGAVYAVPARRDEVDLALGREPGRWVVRHYRRGGAVASLLGDRYLRIGRPRPFVELEVSEEVRRRTIPTPRVVAAAVYPSGIFYRGDLVTAYLPDTIELAEVLFDPDRRSVAGSLDRREALTAAGELIRRMAGAGVHHRDLNARNVLLRWTGRSPEAHLIDLDRCRVLDAPAPDAARSMHARLVRSIRKVGKKRELRVPEGELRALAAGVER